MRITYIKHLHNHFPTQAGKLVDYLNFLTLIQDNPKRCQRVSHIVWTERNRLQLGFGANVARCVVSAPGLTPFLLRFIQGALLMDVLSKKEQSPFKAWHLPFLKDERRPFFQIKSRHLAMDVPGREQTPNSLVMEFLAAWEYLEQELPKHGFTFQDFDGLFTILGLERAILSPTHLHKLDKHFSKSRKAKLFKEFCGSPRISSKARLYAQNKCRQISVNGLCLKNQDALVKSYQYRVGKKYSSRAIPFFTASEQLLPLVNACLNKARLYRHAFKAVLQVRALPSVLERKLLEALKSRIPQLSTASNTFKMDWVKAAEKTQDPMLRQKCLPLKEAPFDVLLLLQNQLQAAPRQTHKLFEKLTGAKRGYLYVEKWG